MSTFALRTFLNLTPRKDLRAHLEFAAPATAQSVDWSLKHRVFVAALTTAIEGLEDDQRVALEEVFDHAGQLASDEGRRAMRSVIAADPDRVAEFDALEDARSCGLWLARIDSQAFDRALAAHFADRRQNGKFWGAYHVAGNDNVTLRREPEAQAAFRDGVRKALGLAGRSVGRVTVEFFDRVVEDPVDGQQKALVQVTVYSEGPPESALEFADDEHVERRTIRPVIAAAALYDPDDRAIEVVANGGRPVHDALAEVFAQTLLAGARAVERLPRRKIAFGRFTKRPELPLRLEDGVSRVHVDKLVLAAPGHRGGTLVLERRSNEATEGDVYDAAAEWFSGRNPIGRAGWRVFHARLRVAFRPVKEGAKPKVVAVEMTAPNRTNLRDQTEAHRMIAHTLMGRWGLYEPDD